MQERQFNFKLKSKIIESGYRTIGQFAETNGLNQAVLSMILNGWRVAGNGHQKKLASGLGITLRELRELL